MWENAQRVADSEVEELRKAKRTDEASHFEAAMQQALARDCIVRVIWMGDADIDVMIKEPVGNLLAPQSSHDRRRAC